MAVYLNSDEILYSFNNLKNNLNRDDKDYEGKHSTLTHCIDLINAKIKIAIQDGEDKYEPVRHSEWVIYEDDDFDYEEPIKVTEETLWQEEHNHPCHTPPQCKECHFHALLNGGEEYVLSNCCPSCGAEMDLKEG